MFGWDSVFKKYTFKDWFDDSVIPSDIAIILSIFFYVNDLDKFQILKEFLSLSLSLLPNMLVLLVAGYTILISFYWSETSKIIKRKSEQGKFLLNNLNSSFAAAIFFVAIFLIISLIIKSIILLEYISIIANEVNTITFGVMIYFNLFSIFVIKDAVIDIYNIGSLSTNKRR